MMVFLTVKTRKVAIKTLGFSLVEMMIALVIGLIVVLGAGQLFITAKQTYDQMESLSSRQQSLRAISDFVSLDIRTASEVLGNGGDDSLLHLSYQSGARPDDPYCNDTSSLEQVKYRFDSENGSLVVSVDCGSGFGSEQELVTGLALAEFYPDPDLDRGLEDGLFVWVDVEFLPLGVGEPEEKTYYRFMVARRGNILN